MRFFLTLFFFSNSLFAQSFLGDSNGNALADFQKYCSAPSETESGKCFQRICDSFQKCQQEKNESCESNIECFKLGQKDCAVKFSEQKTACEKMK